MLREVELLIVNTLCLVFVQNHFALSIIYYCITHASDDTWVMFFFKYKYTVI